MIGSDIGISTMVSDLGFSTNHISLFESGTVFIVNLLLAISMTVLFSYKNVCLSMPYLSKGKIFIYDLEIS